MKIERRNINFELGEAPAPRWCHNNEVYSALFDAFSLFLPPGERFFIRSVQAYADEITDPQLKLDIKDFSAQEALHTREHEAYNNALRKEGVNVDEVYARVNKVLSGKRKIEQLAITVGLEHLTACFGHVTLKHPEFLENSDRRYRDIWTWHSLEEIEHKAVAFDVFRHVTRHMPNWKTYLLRCVALLIATKHITKMHVSFAVDILAVRNHPGRFKAKLKILRAMFIFPGHYRRVFVHYLKFFLPGFSPSVGGSNERVNKWLIYFNQLKKS